MDSTETEARNWCWNRTGAGTKEDIKSNTRTGEGTRTRNGINISSKTGNVTSIGATTRDGIRTGTGTMIRTIIRTQNK